MYMTYFIRKTIVHVNLSVYILNKTDIYQLFYTKALVVITLNMHTSFYFRQMICKRIIQKKN